VACTTANGPQAAPAPFRDFLQRTGDKARVYIDADPAIAPAVDASTRPHIAYVTTPIGTSDFELASYFAEWRSHRD